MPHPSRMLSEPLKPALLSAMQAQLAEGERLTWAASPILDEPEGGAPRPANKRDAVLILGSGYVTLGAVVLALATGSWAWLSVPVLLLVLGVVAYLVAGRIRARRRRAEAGKVYGLTTRRALVLYTYPSPLVQALPIATIADISVGEENEGLADLYLRTSSGATAFTFSRIPDPHRACKQLLQVVRDPQAAEQEIAASEAYALQMRQLMTRRSS